MSKIIKGLFLLLFLPGLAWAETSDLDSFKNLGLSERTLDLMVARSLTAGARSPLDEGFIKKMAVYGGDALTYEYLELDRQSALLPENPIRPELVEQLIDSKVAVVDIVTILTAARLTLADNVQGAVVEDSGSIAETDLPEPVEQKTIIPTAPAAPVAPVLEKARASLAKVPAPVMSREEFRKTPQTLVPGQEADPARPLPLDPVPYPVRSRNGDGHFMGVVEETKPDGHKMEIHSSGRKNQGFEVVSRPSGRKIHRFYSGRTEEEPKGQMRVGAEREVFTESLPVAAETLPETLDKTIAE